MWSVEGKVCPAERFLPFTPVKVLSDYDGPRTFTLVDRDQELFLAHWADEDGEAARFIVVPFSDELLSQLEGGTLSLREALDQSRVYVADVDSGGNLKEVKRVRLVDLPPDTLPSPGVMLRAEHEPLVAIRAVGEEIRPGAVPASTIRYVADGLPKAVRVLADHLFAAARIAQEQLQRLKPRSFEPLAQAVALRSFEIAFRLPRVQPDLLDLIDAGVRDQVRQVLADTGRLLQAGLRWAADASAKFEQLVAEIGSEEAARVVLEAVELLAPQSRGPIQRIEIRGPWVGAPLHPIELTRENRRHVVRVLRDFPSETLTRIHYTGRIRVWDKDMPFFELREIIEHGVMQRVFTFDEELTDDVAEAFDTEAIVRVSGIQRHPTQPARAIQIETLDEPLLGSVSQGPSSIPT